MNLRVDSNKFIFLFLVLIKGMREEVSPRFACVAPGIWELLHSLFAREVS